MDCNRVVVLGSAGVAAAVALALALAAVDRLAGGPARQQASVETGYSHLPLIVADEETTERRLADEPALRDFFPQRDALNPLPDVNTRMAALKEVADLTEVPGLHADSALADAALSHAEPAVREEAIHALGARGGIIAVLTLRQVLQDPSPRIQEAAVRAFVDMDGDEAMRALGPALEAGDAAMRVKVVDALGEIGGPDVTWYMEQMLSDESSVVRETAAEWLAELSGR